MAQARRVDLTTISTQNGTSKNKENKHITLRFEVKLENNDGKSECEFSWLDLVQKNQNGDKIDDLDNDDAHLNAIAKRFEEKYGEKPSAKKKRRIMDDFVDLGNGYDLEDSFIDNDEAYDEVVPHNLKTKWSGFYINNGQLDFRVDSDDEDLIMTKGKRKGAVSSSSSEDESDERQKMRKKVSKNDLYLKKRRQAVDNLIKVKKKKSMGLSLKRKLSEGKATNDIEEVTDDNDNGSDDGNDKNSSLMTNEEKEEGTPKWKKDQNPTRAPELPSFISSDLRSSIDQLKRLAVESKAGKCLFFSNEEVTSLLLKIWMFCKVTSAGTRRIVFEHLAAFLPCNKDTLMKRAKNLANNVTEKKDKCGDLIEKLKSEVAKTMPEQEKKYLEEKEAWAAKNKIEGNAQEGSVSNIPGANNDNKVTMTVRRKFRWTKELRSILNDLIESKMKEWENMETKFLPADEFLKKFLENDVKKLWPKGWIQVRTLFNDTRMVHKDLTGGDWIPKNQRKTSEATNNSISTANNTSTSIQSPNVDSTNMKGSKLLNFATDSLLAVARSKENKRKLESEEKAKNSELAKPASISITNTTETKTSPSKQTPTTKSEMCKVYLKGSSISESSFYESFKKSFLTAGLPINKATDLSAQITKNLVNNYMSKSKQTSPSGKSSTSTATATATSTQPNSSSQIHSGYSNMISSLAKVVKSNELSKTTTSTKSSNEVKGYAAKMSEVIDLSTGATNKPKSANSLDEAIESLKAFNSFSSSQEMVNKPVQVVELQQKSTVPSTEQRKVEEAKTRKARKLDTKLAQLQQQRQKQQAIRMEKQFNKPKQEQNAFPASIDCFLVDNNKTSPEKTTNILIPKRISPSKQDIYVLKPEARNNIINISPVQASLLMSSEQKRLGHDEPKVMELEDPNFRFDMEIKEELKRQDELKRKSIEMIKKQQEELKKRREEELQRRKQQEEMIRKQKEEQIRKQQEDLLRKQQEDQFRKKQELIRQQQDEQLRIRKQQEEQQLRMRKQQEEQFKLRKQQEELLRKQQQEEQLRKQEELRRKQQQEELRKQQQEEIRRKQQQEEIRRKQQQEEMRRKQEEMKKKQEEALIKKQREDMLKLQEQKQRSQVYSTWSHSIGASVITTAQATSTHSKPNVVWSQNQNLTGSYPSLTIRDFSLPDLSASDALIPQMEIQNQQQQQQPTSIAFQQFSPRLSEANPRLRHQRPF